MLRLSLLFLFLTKLAYKKEEILFRTWLKPVSNIHKTCSSLKMLQSLRPASALDRIDRLHGGDEFRAALVEVVAAFVHRFAGESYHADGLG